MKTYILVAAALLVASPNMAKAADKGFRWNGKACVDSKGVAGLNPGYLGQCGDLRKSQVKGIAFEDTDFSGANFEGAEFQTIAFNGSVFKGTSFKGSKLNGSSFIGATIKGASFAKAEMINVKLAGADISESDFSGVDLSGTVLSTISLVGNKLTGANLSGASLDAADLRGVNLNGANMMSVNLQSAKLDEAMLVGAILLKANLTSASMVGVKAATANFSGALLREANLTGSSLLGANLKAAQMDKVNLTKSDFQIADLRGAVLKEATMTDAIVSGAKISMSTQLPMSMPDAVAMGMVIDRSGSTLIICEYYNAFLSRVVAAFNKAGLNVTVAPQTNGEFMGDMDLSDYTTILHMNSADYNTEMPAKGQQLLVKFVEMGGTYINMAGTALANQNNRNVGLKELSAITTKGSLSGNIILNTGKASHPLLTGFGSTVVLNNMNWLQGTVSTYSEYPAQMIAADSANLPMVVVRPLKLGQSVIFGFCAGDIYCQMNPDVQKFLTNAAKWGSQSPAFHQRMKLEELAFTAKR